MVTYLVFGPLVGAVLFSLAAVLPDVRRAQAPFSEVVGALYLFFLFFGLLFSYLGGVAAALASGVAHICVSRAGVRGGKALLCVSGVAALAQLVFLAAIGISRGFLEGVALFVPMAAVAGAILNGLIQWRESERHNRSVNADAELVSI